MWKSQQTVVTREPWPQSPRPCSDTATVTANMASSFLTPPTATVSSAVVVLLLHENKQKTQVCWWSRSLLCTCGNNRTFWSQDFYLGGYCYSSEMPSSKEECWLDSVTFHYRHACLPKIREDASVNIVGDLGMTASRSLNMTIRIAGWKLGEEEINQVKRRKQMCGWLLRVCLSDLT